MISKTHQLPSFYDYASAVKYFDSVPQPRSDKWNPDQRPLDDARKLHYRIERDPDVVSVVLYATPIVTWLKDGTVILDLTYDSDLTRNFARRFLPLQTYNYRNGGRSTRCLRYEGMWYTCDRPFKFINECNEHGVFNLRLISTPKKPLKRRLKSEMRPELNRVLKPFVRWVRDMWALCGNTGAHPFLGDKYDTDFYTLDLRALLGYATHPDVTDEARLATYAKVAKEVIPRAYAAAFGINYSMMHAEVVLSSVRARVYKQADAYEWVPYDE